MIGLGSPGRVRPFAWLCVIAGLVIGSISVSYAIHETTMHEEAWIQRELRNQNAARLRRLIRDIDEEVRPAGVIVSPWPGVVAGGCVTALGIIVLAIRRPERKPEETL